MSFSIIAAGTADQVRAQVQAAHCAGDTAQFNRVRDLILSEVDDLDASTREGYTPGMYVTASGHHDTYSRNLNLTMVPVWIPIVPS